MKRATGFLVNGYPDGEMAYDQTVRAQRRHAAYERWQRIQSLKYLRQKRMEAAMTKLRDMQPIALLDCSYAAQDLFNAVPRLCQTDQATLVDYVEMRLEMWRKGQSVATDKGVTENDNG